MFHPFHNITSNLPQRFHGPHGFHRPHGTNVCTWNTDYYGRNYLRCGIVQQTSNPTTCAHLFSTNQEVPVSCCDVFGIGCTPGNNSPISYYGVRNF